MPVNTVRVPYSKLGVMCYDAIVSIEPIYNYDDSSCDNISNWYLFCCVYGIFMVLDAVREWIIVACAKVFVSQGCFCISECLLHIKLSRMPIQWNRSGFRVVKHALHQLSSYENSLFYASSLAFISPEREEELAFHFHFDHRFRTVFDGGPIKIELRASINDLILFPLVQFVFHGTEHFWIGTIDSNARIPINGRSNSTFTTWMNIAQTKLIQSAIILPKWS